MFSQVTWFFRLVHVENSPKRLFALEVMGKLLAENEREKPNESMMGEHDYGFGNNSQCVVNPETGTFSPLIFKIEFLVGFLLSFQQLLRYIRESFLNLSKSYE